jgi:hypothetical protein
MVGKQVGGQKVKRPDYPVNSADSNEASDRQAIWLHYGLLCLATIVTLGILLWGGTEIYSGLVSKPVGWLHEAWGVSALASVYFVGRGLFWLSIISPIMVAAKGKGWHSQEKLCRKALKFGRFIPGGGLTVAFMLVQSLLTRGQYDDAIVLGEEQNKLYEHDSKMAEGLGPLCGAIGMAHQIKGDARQSITWSEKAIEAYTKSLEKYTSTKRTWFTKLAEAQGGDIAGSIRQQMTVSYFNNASSYFNMQNFRMAKANFHKALEAAKAAPEFPEKTEIVKACREQMSRLKHN